MQIRPASKNDIDAISEVYLAAFEDDEKHRVSALACELLDLKTEPETISLVAISENNVVGHIAFSPVFNQDDENWLGYILAPLAVKPSHQHRQIGSRLVKSGLERVMSTEAKLVFVYGDPGFYGRFGFSCDAAARFTAPYDLEYPHGWLANYLDEGFNTELTVNISCAPPLQDPQFW